MAALITADADATMAADVITDVDVTVDGDFQAEIIPAVISSGSSSFCAAAAGGRAHRDVRHGCSNGCGGCGNGDNCWIIIVLLLLCGNNGCGCGC